MHRVSLLLVVMCVAGCDANDAGVAAPRRDGPTQIERVQLLDCPDPDLGRSCEYDHATVPGYYDAALQGDYQAQRNLSYTFSQQASWIVERPVQACGWRMVIMATRPADSVYDDAGMYQIQCGGLSEPGRADARTLANDIHRRIHGSDLPEVPPLA